MERISFTYGVVPLALWLYKCGRATKFEPTAVNKVTQR